MHSFFFFLIFTNYNNKVEFIFKYNQGAKCHQELLKKKINDICKSNKRKLNLNGYTILIGLTRIQKCTQKCKKKKVFEDLFCF